MGVRACERSRDGPLASLVVRLIRRRGACPAVRRARSLPMLEASAKVVPSAVSESTFRWRRRDTSLRRTRAEESRSADRMKIQSGKLFAVFRVFARGRILTTTWQGASGESCTNKRLDTQEEGGKSREFGLQRKLLDEASAASSPAERCPHARRAEKSNGRTSLPRSRLQRWALTRPSRPRASRWCATPSVATARRSSCGPGTRSPPSTRVTTTAMDPAMRRCPFSSPRLPRLTRRRPRLSRASIPSRSRPCRARPSTSTMPPRSPRSSARGGRVHGPRGGSRGPDRLAAPHRPRRIRRRGRRDAPRRKHRRRRRRRRRRHDDRPRRASVPPPSPSLGARAPAPILPRPRPPPSPTRTTTRRAWF